MNSLAERCDLVRLARYETVSLGRREAYFDVSCRVYACARCERPLYASDDKWSGPCLWPSWRRDLPGAARHAPVEGYNGYVVDVHELYCGGCDLFLGHAFADARDKGDAHPDARWRH
ncbi:peptide-methionine (R)-S-oxide reductase [Aureococcus anophagefferens]|nr:peptide-methionine (R)-S-oxide reductase [Aureococcus anophagefferens]